MRVAAHIISGQGGDQLALRTSIGPWVYIQLFAFVLIVGALSIGFVILLRASKRDRLEAQRDLARWSSEMDEVAHKERILLREAAAVRATDERERADHALKGRLHEVMNSVSEGFAGLERRIESMEHRDAQRQEDISARLEAAMADLRSAGRACVRFVLESFGLENALEDLRWNLEAAGRMRVALSTEGLGAAFAPGDQAALYLVVSDAVEAMTGRQPAGRLDIRLNRSTGRCGLTMLRMGSGEERREWYSGAWGGRLESRIAALKGTIEKRELPHGGRSIHMEIPLAR